MQGRYQEVAGLNPFVLDSFRQWAAMKGRNLELGYCRSGSGFPLTEVGRRTKGFPTIWRRWQGLEARGQGFQALTGGGKRAADVGIAVRSRDEDGFKL